MADSRKRQRLSEDVSDAPEPAPAVSENDPDRPSKKARKETNASARRTLFVRSLPAIATSDKLTELFSQSYPLKHATVVMDTETKQSKGYGFVTFADAEDAQRAVDEFNGQKFLGRNMRIEIAQPRSREVTKDGALGGKKKSTISAEAAAIKKGPVGGDGGGSKITQADHSKSSLEYQDNGAIGRAVQEIWQIKDTQAGFGFVVMRGKKNAEKALAAVNGITVDGRMLAVDWAVEKDAWEKQKKDADSDAEDESDDGGAKVADEEPKSENEEDDVANFFKNFGDQLESEDEEEAEQIDISDEEDSDIEKDNEESDAESSASDEEPEDIKPQKVLITDNSTTLFIRNLPFTTLDADLKEHFNQFGPVRYARVVMDRATARPKGTGFVCFFKVEDADSCFRNAPRGAPSGANAINAAVSKVKHSLLEDENADLAGMYTIDGRVMQISKAVEKETAVKLTEQGTSFRDDRDKDKRKLYLLSEGTVAAGTALYEMLAPSEVKMREDSATQRKKLIQNNPTLHLSLTRLSIRNLPKNINSKDLKALAREAAVGFAKDVKAGLRAQLSKEEESRGGDEMRDAEKQRKLKGKGIVRQAKIVFEGREGAKVSEESGAGRSRGYGFVEYSSHRWALMGLRWLNGHAVENSSGKKQRLITEFAIENAQVVSRRKEREEKARVRSKEVLDAREKGDAPAKEKMAPRKDTVMAKTRKGMKGKKGRPEPKPEKSFDKILPKRKREDDAPAPSKKSKKGVASRTASPPRDDMKVSKRGSIIQKKRMLRKKRQQGHA
ncbi:putative RNA-binding protein [Lachnellula subtilissima]|uniref:Putative RNA-binding protein n=1 Tax=Lachnellula subtilissima TaxID=602034 RepID=A0A8H8RWR7_9HELO|nr:putative RNA-binding protein [Lachnellula subtilissima]